ncbi:succinyl-CoA synthetase subunit alpha [Candidatus Micrarchaeota archaeon]|nr:succinyl-CoA synthetase subunit alpha [Candidatus Micrarchaeota archaeon]
MSKNFEWYINANLEHDAGNWIVIIDEKIVASGIDLKSLLEETDRKFPHKESLIARIPTKDTLIL